MSYPTVGIDLDLKPIGTHGGTAGTAAMTVSVPVGANAVLMQSTSGTAYWTLAGTAGTATGFLMPPALDPFLIPLRAPSALSVLGTVQYQFCYIG